jgi:hypothetical protein
VVDSPKTILAPTLCVPRAAQRLHEYLGYDGQLFGTQHVIEYQEETRSHAALPYDHSGAIGRCCVSRRRCSSTILLVAP